MSEQFTEVPSLCNERSPRHVKNFEYYIVRYEEVPVVKREEEEHEDHLRELVKSKQRIRTQVSLEDIMKPKKIKEGTASTSKDRKFLLLGNPGTGKTCVTKSFAHGWATLNMGGDFDVVYLLRVRDLTNASLVECSRRKTDLPTVIAIKSFPQGEHSDDEFEASRKKIKDDLEKTTTLLILDGVDEGDKTGSAMVQEALKSGCHMLLTSRPYNLTGIRPKVGIEMECLGFNDEQLKRFIEGEVSEGAKDLIEHLRATPSIWEIAHVPITAGILCCVWNEKREAHTSDKAMPQNRLFLYDHMANFIWERYVRKFDAPTSLPDRKTVFNALEEIAFHARENGEILIGELLFREHSPDGKIGGLLQDSGFLLLQIEGTKYQFPHLTFQEYYAGLFLAKYLVEGNLSERKTASEFIAKNKYKEVHRDTLSLMMQKMTVLYKDEAIAEIFHIIDQEPRDIFGVQHTILKLRMVEAFVSANGDLLAYKDCHDRCKEVVDTASNVFCSLGCEWKHLRWIIRQAEQSCNVLEHFPELINPLVEQTIAKSGDGRKWLFEYIGELVHCSPAVWRVFEDFMPRQMLEDEDCRSRLLEDLQWFQVKFGVPEFIVDFLDKSCRDSSPNIRICACLTVRRIISNHFPHVESVHGRKFYSLLTGLLSDEDSSVRIFSLDAIVSCTGPTNSLASPFWHSIAETANNEAEANVLDKAINDGYSSVRAAAMKAFIRFIPVLQDRAMYVQQKISIGCSDPERRVQLSMVEALDYLARHGEENGKIAYSFLLQLLEVEDASVRCAVLDRLKHVAERASIDASSVQKLLTVKLTDDQDADVRVKAMRGMAVFIIEATDDSEGLMNVLAKACAEKDVRIRKEACNLIAFISKEAPSMMNMCSTVLKTMHDEKDSEVRSTARRRFLELTQFSAPSKDTSSDDLTITSIEGEDPDPCIGEETAHQEPQCVNTEEGKVDHVKSLLEECFGRRHFEIRHKVEEMSGTIQDSERLMIEAASNALESSDDTRHERGLELLEVVVNRIRNSENVPDDAIAITRLLVKASATDPNLYNKHHAQQLTRSLPWKWLFDYCWSSHDGGIVVGMAGEFLNATVTAASIPSSGKTKLVILEGSDEIEYIKDSEKVERFVSKLKTSLPGSQPPRGSRQHIPSTSTKTGRVHNLFRCFFGN